MMKVHYIHAENPEEFDEKVNEFIKDKKVIDIKPYQYMDPNGWSASEGVHVQFYLDAMIMYEGVHNNLKWTQRGRKFIYDTLKEHGILPVLEQPELLPELGVYRP